MQHSAITRVCRNAQIQTMEKAVRVCKKVLKRYGFTLVGRMKLRGERSGKTYE